MRIGHVCLCGAAFAVACAAAMGAGANPDAKTRDAAKDTVVHSVYFWLNDGVTEEQSEQLIRDSKAMLGPLPCVKQLDVGRPLGKARGVVDGSYQVAVVVYFADQAGYDTYIKHPQHLKLVEKHKALWAKIVVYDFVRK